MTEKPPVNYGIPEAPPPKRLNPIWIGVGLVSILFLVSVGVGIYYLNRFWDFRTVAGRLDKDVAAAKAAGLPLEAKELNPPPVVDSENAAPGLIEAANTIMGLPKPIDSDAIKLAGDGGSDPERAQVLLDKGKDTLALAEKSLAKPRYVPKRDWDLGPALLFPDYAGDKRLAKLFVARAELSARKGDHAAAVRDLRLARRVGECVGSEPTLIGMLVGIACDSIVVAGAEKCLALASSATDIDAYGKLLKTGPVPIDPERVVRGEAYEGIAAIRNLRRLGGARSLTGGRAEPLDPKTLQRSGMPSDTMSRAYMARTLEMWTACLNAAKKEQEPGAAFNAVSKAADNYSNQPGLSNLLVRVMAPVYGSVAGAVRKDEAQWRTADALAQSLRFRAEHGRFPKNLAEIHFNRPDPFGGGLLYRTDGKSVRIYSVGPDGADNQGKQRYEVKVGKQEGWDIASSYPPSMMKDAAKILLKR